ncbi:MAG: division/cell wall cluster transcriptional repressor MraZ [Proteobacteria bacterium]|nr:division/cell wall cluster transcriptional repressor MraZ [Pseudomonadota bacterium]
MALFLDCHVHKIDRKGRVSVPAQFRAALMNQSFAGVIAFPSFRENCDAIEACGMDRMNQLSESLDNLDPFSNEQNDMAAVLFGAAVQLPFDGEGRIMLPDRLRDGAGIVDRTVFVGCGKTFQMWAPEAHAEFAAEARDRARESRAGLRLSGPAGGGGDDRR